MIYQDAEVRIRPFEKTDMSQKYRSWFNDPETTKHNSHGLFPYSPEAMAAFVAAIEGDRSKIIWAIEISVQEEKRPQGNGAYYQPPREWIHVGNVALQSINLLNRSAELAIVIGEASARGKGIGQRACYWAIRHAFMKLGLNRVWTGTSETNVPMQKVCIALGMKQEGTFIDGMFLNGKFVDVYAYGITREEFNK